MRTVPRIAVVNLQFNNNADLLIGAICRMKYAVISYINELIVI